MQKSSRNRTLTVSPDETERLDAAIVSETDALSADCGSDMLICGDMLRVLRGLPDGFARLIIADPPYNLSKRFGAKDFKAMNSEDYLRFVESWIGLLCDKLHPEGSMYVCADWRSSLAIQQALSSRLTIMNRITWQREKGRSSARNWKNSMEDIWFAVKNPHSYYFDAEAVKQRKRVLAPYRAGGQPKDWADTSEGKFRMTGASNFWDDISIPFWSMPENTEHPTQKPEKLYAKLILASSRPGDIVLDPFAGSGTAAVTARKLGRRFCAIEIDRDYCRLAAKRLILAEERPEIQGYADGVFWERNSEPQRHNKKQSSLS